MKYLLNGIRCDKLPTAVTSVRVHPDKYEKDFDAVNAVLTQHIDKIAPTPNLKVSSLIISDLPNSRGPELHVALSKRRMS